MLAEDDDFFEDENEDVPQETYPETGRIREISWEAPEHHHVEKSSDWYWAMGIIVVSGAIATILIYGDVMFSIVILLAGLVTALISSRPPRIVQYSVSLRGVRIGRELHPYSSLKCFYINEDHPRNVELLLQSKGVFVPLMIIPVPDDAVEEVEYLLEEKLPEVHLEESLGHRLLEFLGF